MRTMLKVCMDVDAANRTLHGGAMPKEIDEVLGFIQPEAVYFGAQHGKRTAFIVFDLKDPSLIPRICEPFFNAFKAEVDLIPVMNRDEVAKGLKSFSESGARRAA